MSTTLKALLAATAAASLLCAPAVSMAAYASGDPLASGGAFGGVASPAPDFLSQAVSQMQLRASPDTHAASPFTGEIGPPEFVQSAAARRNPLSIHLRGRSDLFMWNLVAMARAHRENKLFDLVDTGLTSIVAQQKEAAVSAVPLPGAIWLFVMGVLGLAGTRITGIRGVARERDTARPLGAAVAA